MTAPAATHSAEELSRRSERLLLTTATPHSGDRTRFLNFLKLLDPDQFSVEQLAAEQIGRDDSPYFLRREKERLTDEHGDALFVPRQVLSQPFSLTELELRLYEDVTAYIQEFLGAAGGRRGTAIALARTVLQRRLASSLGAIRSSLEKRAERIGDRIAEVEALPPGERAARLARATARRERRRRAGHRRRHRGGGRAWPPRASSSPRRSSRCAWRSRG